LILETTRQEGSSMMRQMSAILLGLSLVFLVGCGADDETAPESNGKAADCCSEAMAVVKTLPQCCQDNLGKDPADWGGCCKEGLNPATADEDRKDCCKQTMAARSKMKACCADHLFEGKTAGCCADMPVGGK